MLDGFDVRAYFNQLVITINETCDNARSALNVLMGISVVMASLTFGVDDEVLFLDQGAILPYTGIPITVSMIFAIFPIIYLVIYGLLSLKLNSITNLIYDFKEVCKKIIEIDYKNKPFPLTYEDYQIYKQSKKRYYNHLKSFFFLDCILHRKKFDTLISLILTFIIPAIILIYGMIKFLPYQSWQISLIHLFSIFSLCTIYWFKTPLDYRWHKSLLISFTILISSILYSTLIYRLYYGKADNYQFIKTTLDLSNRTLVKKEISDEVLAVAYEKYAEDNDYEKFNSVKWKQSEGHFLRNRSFKGINLSDVTAYKIDLRNSDLNRANLSHSRLQMSNFSESNLQNAVLYKSNLQYTSLSHANLQEADMKYVNAKNSNLSYSNLEKAELLGSNLQETKLSNANLQNANLYYPDRAILSSLLNRKKYDNSGLTYVTDVRNADLSYSNLKKANLSHSNFHKADLSHASLQKADLSYSNLQKANLHSSNLKFAKLNYTNLSEAYMVGIKMQNVEPIVLSVTGSIYNSLKFKRDHFSSKELIFFNISNISELSYNSLKETMFDICTEEISSEHWNSEFEYMEKRKRKTKGYDYSSYCKKE